MDEALLACQGWKREIVGCVREPKAVSRKRGEHCIYYLIHTVSVANA